ncbi:MAG: ethylbenzene dehydrogenase [Candidatus Tectomicrobia bacterium]|uniref:Ethylbenzene dehydrogenase n=1 Tax=Tectimicrobiota bacterium TaxID=2528274 RepID=A0A932M1A8_UNCTE|nr:ethylbenzene dehydrogenase [Candidatus Tectomicrobia bacterium]
MKKRFVLFAVLLVFAALSMWKVGGYAQDSGVLTAKKVAKGPVLDGKVDALWNQAKAIKIPVSAGANFPPNGSTTVTLKAVYTDTDVYFLAQWGDKTRSYQRSPWKKQADGSWAKLKDPNDKGGDNNKVYEDKLSVIWNVSAPAFESAGCMAACHAGEAGKPYGNMYTANPGELGDMWHWKAVRTNPVGQIDDQYLDNTPYDKDKSPNAGRKTDPKTGGGYVDNQTDDKKMPKFAAKGNKPAPPYWILDKDKEPFDDSKYKAGNEVAGIMVAPFEGDRGDISARASWSKGVWTLEISRKLKTGSKYDVQFDDLSKQYAFGVAAFDNASVRHAFAGGPSKLAFGK